MSHQKSHTGNINITSDSEKAWQKFKNNLHSHTNPHQGDHMPAINNKTSHANFVMPSLSTTLVHYLVLQISTSLVLRTYKESQEMPLQEQQIPLLTLPTQTLGTEENIYCRNKIKPLVFPFWGECPLYFFYLQYPICLCCLFVFHFNSNLPYSLVNKSLKDLCCSYPIPIDTVHLVPSVEAV